MWAWLGEYWRIALVVLSGLAVLAVRRRVPRWVLGGWAVAVAAVVVGWLVDMAWRGTLVVFVGMALIASAYWLRAEEHRAATTK